MFSVSIRCETGQHIQILGFFLYVSFHVWLTAEYHRFGVLYFAGIPSMENKGNEYRKMNFSFFMFSWRLDNFSSFYILATQLTGPIFLRNLLHL